MDNIKTIYLHIGTHKTGTTSIQHYMQANYKQHFKSGMDFYKGLFMEQNHIELHVATMRKDRLSIYKHDHKINVDDDFKINVKNRVRDFIENSAANKILFSAEGLSYLRYDDELAYLREIFKDFNVYIILCLRDKASFLKSYSLHLTRNGYTLSDLQGEFNYIKEDTWLLDYDKLIDVYGRHFGFDRLIILNYNNAMNNYGSILPPFLQTVGIKKQAFNILTYWYNKA